MNTDAITSPEQTIAESLVKIADAMKALEDSGLKRKTIVMLLHGSTGLPKREIAIVLDHLRDIKEEWVKA